MKSLRRIKAILWKEVVQLRRDRITFAMIILIPLIQLALFGYSINTNIRNIPVGILDFSHSELGQILEQILEATDVVEFTQHYTSIPEAQKGIQSGEVRAVLILPSDLAQRLARSPSVGLGLPPSTNQETSRPVGQWIVDGSDTTIAGAIKSFRNMPLTELLKQPPNRNTATFEVALFYNPEQRSAINIVPGLVGVILTMTMIMFTSAAIVRESERGNMEMLINTPVWSLELMIGKIIPYIFIGLLQAIIILALGHFLFGVPFGSKWISLLGGTLLFIGSCLSLGLVLSTIATNQLQAMQMTVFILLPSILLSGFMFPFEGMPVIAQYISELLPATHFMRIIRGIVLRDATLAEMQNDMIWLIAFFVIGILVAALRFKKRLD
ncbi:ABC transporter permease [Flexibacterium corallicola]|uniref:ABC transporter permease n=1 Tax=Flexibacterium corallicola TaxID=3037259 RepID=UPI00286EC52B|nr:ABC transporter permease [Pseudovibrio sp. M1P-2-3]